MGQQGLKLTCTWRWKYVKQFVALRYGVIVHFQAFHASYFDAYQYVIKEDSKYVTSPVHLIFTNSTQTKRDVTTT